MKKGVVHLLLVLPFFALSQGINFERHLTWKQVKEKARAENKFIFIDCFATWCGPCKSMERNIFPDKKVGDFFNRNFINVELQLDSTGKDNEDIKAWYKDGQDLTARYSVQAFPTFLFFNPDGGIVHRLVGAAATPDEFVASSSDALDSTKQYYTQIKKFEAGSDDVDFLKKGAEIAMKASDYNNAGLIFNQYLALEKNRFTRENLEFARSFTMTTKGKGFWFFLDNGDKVDSVLGTGATDNIVMPIIASEEIYTKYKIAGPAPDWNRLKATITAKYPQKKFQVERMVAWAKVGFFQATADWHNYAEAADDYMKSYGEFADAGRLNDIAVRICAVVSEKNYLDAALAWSKKSLQNNENNPVYISTYANLLYKLGKIKDAIAYQEKAVQNVPESENFTYKERLEKMKKGQKTW